MRTSGSLPEEFDTTGNAITGLGPGMNGSGGDNRVYGQGSDGRTYNIGRNTFRYPNTWKADLRLAKRFDIGERRQLELIAETFNLFNHQNVTALETTGYSIENSGSSGTLPRSATSPSIPPAAQAAERQLSPAQELPSQPSASRSTSTPSTFTASGRLKSVCACASRNSAPRSLLGRIATSFAEETLQMTRDAGDCPLFTVLAEQPARLHSKTPDPSG